MGFIAEDLKVNSAVKGAIATGMVVAMAFPLYKLYALSHGGTLSPVMNILVTIACVALVAHVIEGAVAGAIAYRRGNNVFKASVYAFFTGFVGLTEILKNESSS